MDRIRSNQRLFERSQFKLNTQDCCFICFGSVSSPELPACDNGNGYHDDGIGTGRRNADPISLFHLCHHLQIDVGEIITVGLGKLLPTVDRTEMRVTLCSKCEPVVSRFTELYQLQEQIRMQIEHCVRTLWSKLERADKDNELLRKYEEERNRSIEVLLHSGVVEELRMELKEKCQENTLGHQPRVKITKLSSKDDFSRNHAADTNYSKLFNVSNRREARFESDYGEEASSPVPAPSPGPVEPEQDDSHNFLNEDITYSISHLDDSGTEMNADKSVSMWSSTLFMRPEEEETVHLTEDPLAEPPEPEPEPDSLSLSVGSLIDRIIIATLNNSPSNSQLPAPKQQEVPPPSIPATTIHSSPEKIRKECHRPNFQYPFAVRSQEQQSAVPYNYTVDRGTNRVHCNICGRTFSNTYTCKRHHLAFHAGAKYKRQLCQRELNDRSNFQKHVEVCAKRNEQDIEIKKLLSGKILSSPAQVEVTPPSTSGGDSPLPPVLEKMPIAAAPPQSENDSSNLGIKPDVDETEELMIVPKDPLETDENPGPPSLSPQTRPYPTSLIPAGVNRKQRRLGRGIFNPKYSLAAARMPNGNYKCEECQKEYKASTGYVFHVNSVHFGIKHKCTVCHKSFIDKNYFKLHRLKCTGERLIRYVSGPKNFSCKICQKAFCRELLLTKHFRAVHLKIRDFACNICSKKFSDNVILKTHRQRVHFPTKFQCPKDGCGKLYTTQAYFERHLKRDHFLTD